jgi:hypothetical protein
LDVSVKLTFNFIQTISFLNYFNILWPDNSPHLVLVFEQIGSLGVQLVTSNCLWKDLALANVYLRVIVYSVSPLVFALVSSLVLGLISWVKKDTKYVKEINIDMNLSFFFLIQPYILKTSLDLLSCRTVNLRST